MFAVIGTIGQISTSDAPAMYRGIGGACGGEEDRCAGPPATDSDVRDDSIHRHRHGLMMIDPLLELPYDERRGRLMYRQVAALACSFFDFGIETVLIVGNALHTREGVD
jgi:hypothetical protein